MNREERQRNHEKWQSQVAAYRSSGLSRRDYCRQNQISPSTLDYWCRKLKPASPNSNTLDHDRRWVPLTIHDESASRNHQAIRLHIGRVELAVESGFDSSTLADVIRVVAACSI